MQQMGQVGDPGRLGRQRVETAVQTLAALGRRGESLAEVAHDARNMVTALGLYCDLLEEPGVLAVPFAHYGNELRLVAVASRRLVEKLVALDTVVEPATLGAVNVDTQSGPDAAVRGFAIAPPGGWAEAAERNARPDPAPGREPEGMRGQTLDLCPEWGPAGNFDGSLNGSTDGIPGRSLSRAPERGRQWETMFAAPVDNLAAELLANRNLLSALAGPAIAVTVDAEEGARAVRLSAEDLTRVLVNLVKNAAEVMAAAAGRGRIQISLQKRARENGPAERVAIVIEDDGPGIALPALDRIFDSGFTTHAKNPPAVGGWPSAHRGLGLAITRSIVDASGGQITASNRAQGGARFEIELPVRRS